MVSVYKESVYMVSVYEESVYMVSVYKESHNQAIHFLIGIYAEIIKNIFYPLSFYEIAPLTFG